MKKPILLTSTLLSIFIFSSWIINYIDNTEIQKVIYSMNGIIVSYLFFKILIERIGAKRISQAKTRYIFRKTSSFLFLLSAFIIVLRIWVVNPQALLVAYGLIAAGVAIALQDVFKNFAGGLVLFLSGMYKVGDRIELNDVKGDVMDIGLFYTTMLEIGQWVDGDQSTGRLVVQPNGYALSFPVRNYTKDHEFLWDEIQIPITYESDWKEAIKKIKAILKEEIKENEKIARSEIDKLGEKYFLSKRNTEVNVFLETTDNWIMLKIRYVTQVRDRRIIQNAISQKILQYIEKAPTIHIASTTLFVTSKNIDSKK